MLALRMKHLKPPKGVEIGQPSRDGRLFFLLISRFSPKRGLNSTLFPSAISTQSRTYLRCMKLFTLGSAFTMFNAFDAPNRKAINFMPDAHGRTYSQVGFSGVEEASREG